MIMKIYVVGFILVLVSLCLYKIFESEYLRFDEYSKSLRFEELSKTEKQKKLKYMNIMYILTKIFRAILIIFVVAFYCYNIYIISIKYEEIVTIIAISAIIAMTSIILSIIMYNIDFKYFENLQYTAFCIWVFVAVISTAIYGCISFCLFLAADNVAIGNKEKMYTEYSYSIEIVEMEEHPYTDISGRRYYIRSAPAIAYYYDVITETGNKTTKILDGSEYYVEKNEDDKYTDNPHIEVYKVMKEYTSLYGNEKKDFVTYEYVICVPENSIYYEK